MQVNRECRRTVPRRSAKRIASRSRVGHQPSPTRQRGAEPPDAGPERSFVEALPPVDLLCCIDAVVDEVGNAYEPVGVANRLSVW